MPKLTQAALRGLIKKPGRHSDGGGLYFRVLGEGKAYFVYRFTVAGRERETSLGPFPELSLAEAREKHAALRKMVKTDKIDPIAQKHVAKTAQPSAVPTFGAMADEYVTTHEATWRSDKHKWQWKQTLGEYCAAIRSKPVNEISTAEVLLVLKPLWTRAPETGSRLRGRIEAVLDAARALGHVPEDKANPARWRGHLDHLLAPPKKLSARGHHRAMSYGDIGEFVKRLRAVQKRPSGKMAALALEFLILSATRSSETINAQWSEFDLEAAVWSIPPGRMKTYETFSVPLSDRALDILATARRAARKGPTDDSFVFFGIIPKRPLSNMALSMLMRRMGADGTPHGFRSTFRTWCSDVAHVEFEVAESCLSHRVGNAVSRAYNRSDMLERRRPVMERWAAFLSGEAGAKVVALNGGRKRS